MRVMQYGFGNSFGLVGKGIRRYLTTTALTATGLMAIMSPALAEGSWSNMDVIAGSQTVTLPDAHTTNIKVHTMDATVRGDADIHALDTVNIDQISGKSKYIVYDTKNDPTKIMGKLNANGQVYIFDKNGVIFGKDSQVNVGSIVASTGTISDANLQAGKLVFDNVGGPDAGSIELNGTITVADAGVAAFVAPTVVNNGVINARMGTVVLAAGEKVAIDLYGDNLVSIAATGALEDALIENKGAINAAGGNVAISAEAAKNAVDSVINMEGVIDVSSISTKGGKIILGGGNKGVVKVAGSLKANGKTGGGKIKVTGENIHLTDTAKVSANAGAAGDGGKVDVIAEDGLIYGGAIEAKGGALQGNGGAVDTSGHGWVDIYGTVDATAFNGANGTWLIDPANLTIVGSGAGSNTTGSNPFSPTGGNFTNSTLRNTVVNSALTGGTNVVVTTVGSSNKFLQDGTITVNADITSAGSSTLTLKSAGSIILAAGRSIAASTANTLNVVMDAAKDIAIRGVINTRGADARFTAGDDISLTNLAQINTAGGNATFVSDSGSFSVGNGSAVNTAGGSIRASATGLPITTFFGLPVDGNILVNGVLNAGGGNIDLKQSGIFDGDAESLRTSGTGTISLQQNSFTFLGQQLASIQNAIDAIRNTGTGTNTIRVSAGTFKESLKVDHANLVLRGNNAGRFGQATRFDETVIAPNSPGFYVTADNAVIDGFTVTGADNGIHVDGAVNALIKNNIITNSSANAIYFTNGANSGTILTNKIQNASGNGVAFENSDNGRIENNHISHNGPERHFLGRWRQYAH